MSDTLVIRPGGKLIKISGDLDSQSYAEKDVTELALQKLWEPCLIAEGVVLRDVFLLLNSKLEAFDSVITYWCKEIVTEGLSNPVQLPEDDREEEKIEYLELYWRLVCSR